MILNRCQNFEKNKDGLELNLSAVNISLCYENVFAAEVGLAFKKTSNDYFSVHYK